MFFNSFSNKESFVKKAFIFVRAFLFLIATFSPAAFATYLFPEFQGLHRSQAEQLIGPDKINSEYSSDYLTFSKPFDWEREFWSHKNSFDLSTGSLSGEEFFIQDRLKIHQWLIEDKLQFRFTYFAERDFEVDQDHKVLELVYKLSPLLGVSVYGGTSLYKAEDDLGLALLYQPNRNSEHRLFHSWIDYDRNERNKQNDRFAESPTNFGLIGRQFEGNWFFKYGFNHAQKSIWDFPTNLRRFETQNYGAQAHIQYTWGDHYWLGAEVFHDDTYESESPLPTGSLTEKVVRRKRWMSRNEFTHRAGPYKLRWGLAYYYRDYRINKDRVLFRDLLPYWAIEFKAIKEQNFDWVNEVGLESTFHRGTQTANVLADAPKNYRQEYRLNWNNRFEFGTQAELALILTFDLDEFGSGRTWEGGNAQFRLLF